MSLDLSKDSLAEHEDKYAELLCNECRDKLKFRCLPIMNKLNKGFPPSPREIIRLMNTICPECKVKILRRKAE